MKKKSKGKWSILVIAALCVGMIYFFSTLKQNAGFAINMNQNAASSSEEESSEEPYAITAYSYPYYGMRETDLNHCLLGKPLIVSECSNFDKLPPGRKTKYYYFGIANTNNSGKIIVKYSLYDEKNDRYVDFPSDNGYVDSGYYVNTSGVEYQIDSYGISETEEETEASTETEKKKNGGTLRPGSKDNGNGSSSGTTSAKKSTSATTEFDPDDHDIDGYYEDNKDIFDSYDEAYDAFEDDEDAWDDY